MDADILIEDARWSALGLEVIVSRASGAVAARFDLPEDAGFSVLACDDARIAVLNAEFRDKPQPTNVLSWPEAELTAEDEGARPAPPEADVMGEMCLGDIAIAYDTCAREAAEADKPLADHVTHLIVHGLLHLLGFDHLRDGDATLMEWLETEILGNLGLADPYSENRAI